jgi:hypothetical protein
MPVLRTGSGGGGHVSQSVTEQNRCTRTSTGRSSGPARRAVDIHAQGVVIQGFWSWASELSPAVVNARRKALNWNLELKLDARPLLSSDPSSVSASAMPVTLVDIPVLGFAYKFKKIAPLAAGTGPRHPYNASLLDRVSV